MNKTLPKTINAMKVVSYNVESLVQIISEDLEVEADAVTLEMIMERVGEWASSDINESQDDLITYQDENGEDIEQ